MLMVASKLNVEEAKKLAEDFKDIARTFSNAAGVMNGTVNTVKSVKSLINRKGNGLGSKLISAGVACVIFPEPVFSDMLGSMLIAAGVILNKSKGPTVFDIFREAGRIGADLRRISRDLDVFRM
jgi:hypothetical protein